MFTKSTLKYFFYLYTSFFPVFSKVAHSHFQGLGWKIRHFPVLILGISMQFGPKRPKVNLRSPRGQPGSIFHIWVQNPMGVLTTMFHPYLVNTTQVNLFLRSSITFPVEKLLTPEGVAGGVSITRGLFSGMSCNI